MQFFYRIYLYDIWLCIFHLYKEIGGYDSPPTLLRHQFKHLENQHLHFCRLSLFTKHWQDTQQVICLLHLTDLIPLS